MIEADAKSNVVLMGTFRQSMNHPALSQVEGYWEGLRSGRLMPARSEVDPRGISGALEYAFILERVARGIGRFRLAGTTFSALMGMEVRGMPLTALMTPDSRPLATEALEAVFDTPAVIRLALEGEAGVGRPALAGQMILLPLRSDLGDITRVLGCLVTDGQIGRTPRRFAITDQHRRALTGFGEMPVRKPAPAPAPRPTPQPAPGLQPVPAPQPGFAERGATFAARTGETSPAGRPYLRLVKSDD